MAILFIKGDGEMTPEKATPAPDSANAEPQAGKEAKKEDKEEDQPKADEPQAQEVKA